VAADLNQDVAIGLQPIAGPQPRSGGHRKPSSAEMGSLRPIKALPADDRPGHDGIADDRSPVNKEIAQKKKEKTKALATLQATLMEFSESLPTKKDPTSKAVRKKLFSQMDGGNGILSLTELHSGLTHVCHGIEAVMNAKPAILYAYRTAVNFKARPGQGLLTRDKFRVLLVYLKRYLQLWAMFVAIDRDGDRRLTPDEMEQALPKLQEWGFAVADSREVFEEMDENAGGYILFDEFADWAIRRSLGVFYDSGDDTDDEEGMRLKRGPRQAKLAPVVLSPLRSPPMSEVFDPESPPQSPFVADSPSPVHALRPFKAISLSDWDPVAATKTVLDEPPEDLSASLLSEVALEEARRQARAQMLAQRKQQQQELLAEQHRSNLQSLEVVEDDCRRVLFGNERGRRTDIEDLFQQGVADVLAGLQRRINEMEEEARAKSRAAWLRQEQLLSIQIKSVDCQFQEQEARSSISMEAEIEWRSLCSAKDQIFQLDRHLTETQDSETKERVSILQEYRSGFELQLRIWALQMEEAAWRNELIVDIMDTFEELDASASRVRASLWLRAYDFASRVTKDERNRRAQMAVEEAESAMLLYDAHMFILMEVESRAFLGSQYWTHVYSQNLILQEMQGRELLARQELVEWAHRLQRFVMEQEHIPKELKPPTPELPATPDTYESERLPTPEPSATKTASVRSWHRMRPRDRAATQIQALWRGWHCRLWVEEFKALLLVDGNREETDWVDRAHKLLATPSQDDQQDALQAVQPPLAPVPQPQYWPGPYAPGWHPYMAPSLPLYAPPWYYAQAQPPPGGPRYIEYAPGTAAAMDALDGIRDGKFFGRTIVETKDSINIV